MEVVSNSLLNDDSNFDLSRSVSRGSNVCVAVNSSGVFVRRSCDEILTWSLCQKNYGGMCQWQNFLCVVSYLENISSKTLPFKPSQELVKRV